MKIVKCSDWPHIRKKNNGLLNDAIGESTNTKVKTI